VINVNVIFNKNEINIRGGKVGGPDPGGKNGGIPLYKVRSEKQHG